LSYHRCTDRQTDRQTPKLIPRRFVGGKPYASICRYKHDMITLVTQMNTNGDRRVSGLQTRRPTCPVAYTVYVIESSMQSLHGPHKMYMTRAKCPGLETHGLSCCLASVVLILRRPNCTQLLHRHKRVRMHNQCYRFVKFLSSCFMFLVSCLLLILGLL